MKKFIVITALLLAGCATSQQQKATTSILIMRDTVIAVATGADALCDAGTISKQDCRNIADMYKKAKVAYPALVDAAILGLEDPTKLADFQAKKSEYMSLYDNLSKTAVEFGILEKK